MLVLEQPFLELSVDLAADEIIAAAVVPTSAARHDLAIRFQW